MKNYFEITLIANSDIGIYELWSKLYTQLHLAFVEQLNQQDKIPIGISFPEYQYKPKKGGYLGSKLRIFGLNEAVLRQLNLPKWLAHLINYIHCSDICEVPNRVKKYAQFRRQRIKGSPENLARRHAKRHGISVDEAMRYYTNKTVVTSDLPYVRLSSSTTGQFFQLYIEKREHNELIQDGFGTYGLSCSSTVPEF